MTRIVQANENDAELLSRIATDTFMESHGHSAPPADVNNYVADKYNADVLRSELLDPANIYHIIYHDNKAAGYSKIILNTTYPGMAGNFTKLERIYLLKEFHGLELGNMLMKFIAGLSRKNEQSGIWLHVWKENPRAVSFYKKHGFAITGSYDFKISETHSNPNHQMLLKL